MHCFLESKFVNCNKVDCTRKGAKHFINKTVSYKHGYCNAVWQPWTKSTCLSVQGGMTEWHE